MIDRYLECYFRWLTYSWTCNTRSKKPVSLKRQTNMCLWSNWFTTPASYQWGRGWVPQFRVDSKKLFLKTWLMSVANINQYEFNNWKWLYNPTWWIYYNYVIQKYNWLIPIMLHFLYTIISLFMYTQSHSNFGIGQQNIPCV